MIGLNYNVGFTQQTSWKRRDINSYTTDVSEQVSLF